MEKVVNYRKTVFIGVAVNKKNLDIAKNSPVAHSIMSSWIM